MKKIYWLILLTLALAGCSSEYDVLGEEVLLYDPQQDFYTYDYEHKYIQDDIEFVFKPSRVFKDPNGEMYHTQIIYKIVNTTEEGIEFNHEMSVKNENGNSLDAVVPINEFNDEGILEPQIEYSNVVMFESEAFPETLEVFYDNTALDDNLSIQMTTNKEER